MSSGLRHGVIDEGFTIIPDFFTSYQVTDLLTKLQDASNSPDGRRRGGTRNLLSIPAIRELALSPPLRRLLDPILGSEWLPVRAILFDKIPSANWKVPWHQDLTIAVDRRLEIEGFGPWSAKAGVIHVQPPVAVLEKMIAVRIHLDKCDEANGPLRVIAGSHRYGRIPEKHIERYLAEEPVTCLVPSGGVLLMRPLLLHASSSSQSPGHRRVIHIEYAACKLPSGLLWHSEIDPAVGVPV
jgi:hypothetical protein